MVISVGASSRAHEALGTHILQVRKAHVPKQVTEILAATLAAPAREGTAPPSLAAADGGLIFSCERAEK